MSGKHVKPDPPGKFRAIFLGVIWAASTALMLASGSLVLGIVFGIISLLYIISWKTEYND